MLSRAWLQLALLTGLAAFPGCSSPPKLEAKGVVEINAPEHPKPEGTAHLLNEVRIHLPVIRAPDNGWIVVLNDERFFQQLRPIATGPDGRAVAAFLAIRAGRRPIRFMAVPSSGREATATQAYEITLTVE